MMIYSLVLYALITSACCTLKEHVLDRLLNEYDNSIRPPGDPSSTYKGVQIKAKIILLGMKSVKQKKLFNHYHVDFILIQSWKDSRLRHDSNTRITLSGDIIDEIWRPDIRIMEEKVTYPTEILNSNKAGKIYKDGTVVTVQRCSIVNYCQMDFVLFPFDTQTCNMSLESYSHDDRFLQLFWESSEVSKNLEILMHPYLDDFDLIAYKSSKTKFSYSGNGTGTHDHLVTTFKFKRPILLNLIRLYLPIQMIVFLSWLSFWIDFRSVPARCTIGVTTVLTFVQVRMSIFQKDVPNGKYINVYDSYSLICFVFVFMAFLEYAWAQSMDMKYRLEDWYKVRKGDPDADLLDYEDTVENTVTHQENNSSDDEKSGKKKTDKKIFSLFQYLDEQHSLNRERFHILDQYSKWVFPITFIIVGIVYTIVIYALYEGKPDDSFKMYDRLPDQLELHFA